MHGTSLFSPSIRFAANLPFRFDIRKVTATQGRLATLALLCCVAVLAGCKHHKAASTLTQARAPKPISLHATEQVAFRVKLLVHAAAGGVLDTTDGEGTRYRLTLPPGALPGDATITALSVALSEGLLVHLVAGGDVCGLCRLPRRPYR